MTTFNAVAPAIGLIIMLTARLSGVVHRSFISLTVVFVVGGFAIGNGGLGLLDIDAHSDALKPLALAVLVIILFVDGLEVDHEMIRSDWRLPAKNLGLAMPITVAIIAVLAQALTDLTWTQCFLLGALIAPTDPILSNSVTTSKLVPERIRHSLGLESGLNDGLALPAILALTAALAGEDFDVIGFLIADLGLGMVVGLAGGFVAAKIMPTRAEDPHLPPHAKSLYALGTAFAVYGIATALSGNGLIATYVAAVTLGALRADIGRVVEERAADVVELAKLAIFVVFGALLTVPMLSAAGAAALVLVAGVFFVARPAAVFLALVGERLPADQKAFMGWFGARGVATVAFSLLVLSRDVPGGEQLFVLCALTVFCSVLLHGFTDTLGASWISKRARH